MGWSKMLLKSVFEITKIASKTVWRFLHILLALSECINFIHTGKYFPEALILASTNPQYDKRLFIELRVQYMKIASSEHV